MRDLAYWAVPRGHRLPVRARYAAARRTCGGHIGQGTVSMVTIGAVWLVDPTDEISHAWRQVDGLVWIAACGRRCAAGLLTEEEDEYRRHETCALLLVMPALIRQGTALADRQDAVLAEGHRVQQAAVRAERDGS